MLTLIAAALSATAAAQESQREPELQGAAPDSLRHANTASILFDRNLNTFNWIGRLSLDTTLARMHVSVAAQLLDNIIQPEGGSSSTAPGSESTQGSFALGLRQPLSDAIGVDARWSSLVFADDRGIGLSNAASHTLLLGMSYSPAAPLSLTPLGGYRWERQGDTQDRGPALGLEADLRPIDLDGYLFAGSGRFRRDAVTPRVLENHNAELSIYKPFGALSHDSLDIGFLQTRREFYSQGDSAIESRTDRLFSLANMLAYNVSDNMAASVFVSIGDRVLDKDLRALFDAARSATAFDTQIGEFRLDTWFQLAYQGGAGGPAAVLKLGYSERSESHLAKAPANMAPNIAVLFDERNREEQTSDNYARRVSLTGGLTLPFSPSTQLFLSGSSGILRYDTPSDLNLEDRDELLVVLTLGLRHRFTRTLEALVTLDGTLSHLVYLLAERSANNNINRVLRLAPRTIWQPASWLSTTNGFEVLANYTVYDFEAQTALVRSFSYRQFSWVDSTQVEFSPRVGLDFFTYLKLYERGLLKWDDFRERTENSYVDRTVALQVRFTPGETAEFALGIRYFSQSRYIFNDGVRTPDTFTSSVGPTTAIRWLIGPHSRLQFEGWYERRRQSDGSRKSLASMTMHLYVHL